MRIVVDTNVLISGVFFGGYPRKVLSAIVSGDKDLLVLESYENIQIVTAKTFYERYLADTSTFE